MQASERQRLHQDQIYQSKMNKLTEDTTALEREYRQRSEDYKRKAAERAREMENAHRRTLDELEAAFRRKVEAIEAKLTEQQANVSCYGIILLSRTFRIIIKLNKN